MAILRLSDNVQMVLPGRCLVGRAPTCDLVLPERNDSGQHAVIAWNGTGWDVQDLGSRNGTYVDDQRLGGDTRVRLRHDSRVRFGRESSPWTLVDDTAPVAMAQRLTSREWRRAEGGYLALPGPEHYECAVYQTSDGGWVVERGSEVSPVADQGTVSTSGGELWRVVLPVAVLATEKEGDMPRLLARLRLRFRHSLDEEQVELTAFCGKERLDLGIRAHHYPLLLLARRRLTDRRAGLTEADEGWVLLDELLQMLNMGESHLNISIHRARNQLGELGVVDAASLVERKPRMRRIRLGLADFEVVPLDRPANTR
jgi:hypothetical protein